MNTPYETHVTVNRRGVVARRDFLRTAGLAGALSLSGLTGAASLQAEEMRKRGMSCILLWMQGAPSQFETFDPKPGHENGGETKAIATSVPGIQIADRLPKLAEMMHELTVLRSLTSREGNHLRATYQLHTGYMPTATVQHPTLGSVASERIPNPDCELPAFVRIGGRAVGSVGAGFLGVQHDPLQIQDPSRMPENTQLGTSADRHNRRLGLMERLERDFADSGAYEQVEAHRQQYAQASRMILSPQMKALDLSREPASVRDAYGRSGFANGCLLARRLVEAGVAFVEISHGNWDTHQDNFERTKQLAGQIDQPYATLLKDLRERGLLDNTLVIWMGEFGRTPRINPNGGRDHYPRAFSAALAGGGVRGGQVIGATDRPGVSIAERPITVPDFFRTVCHSLQIDADFEYLTPIGRPIKTVDGGEVIQEVFG
jgi:hypothetical protein